MADATLTDPLGRTIVLQDSAWFGHIIKAHPEMVRRRAEVEHANRSPAEIRFSLVAVECRVYYRALPAGGRHIAVVADVVAGFVKTAYITKKLKGAPEWPLSPPSKDSSTMPSGTT